MEHNPIARPKKIHENFPDFNIETIRSAVKKWKKKNKEKIKRFPSTLMEQYINEMRFDKNLHKIADEMLKSFIASKKPLLNSEWKGIIAGAIYLASKLLDNNISQQKLAEHINVDSHTIRKRYREIANELNINI
jgi:transcription initiation factor TFIIIB Brf1 subunit/transcription initiation factor TFIIB